MPQKLTITITAKSILLILACVGVIWLIATFSELLFMLFLASLLAVAITPLVGRLEARRVPRVVAILLIYLVLLGIVGAAIGLLAPALIDQLSQLGASLPQLTQRLLALPQNWIAPYFPTLARSLQASALSASLSAEFSTFVGGIGDLAVALGRTLTTILISVFLVLVIAFFLTSDAHFAPRFIARFFPPRYRPTATLLAKQIGLRLGHWVRAQLLVGLFYGVSFGLAMALIGVPYAFSLGVAGAILELIPYVGGAIVTAVAMLVALSVSPLLALGVLAIEIVLALLEGHIVYPKMVGDIVGLHPLAIIIALFIGAEARGVMGALLAVPALVVIQVLFEHFYRFGEDAERAPAARAAEDRARPPRDLEETPRPVLPG